VVSQAVRTVKIESIPYTCPNCGAQVGEFVPVNGAVLLDAGGWLIADGSRHCHRCGRLIHMKAPRDSWPVLVERYLARLAAAAAMGGASG
jgi:hypothetical protein